MSILNIGANDVTEEQQAFKNALASRDSQIAAQQSQLLKQSAELEETKRNFHDALQKLREESGRALSLESSLSRCNEDLKREQIASQNSESAIQTALKKYRAQELETHSLESHLDSMSRQTDNQTARFRNVEAERDALKERVRELELLREANETQSFVPKRKSGIPTRSRSSSVSGVNAVALESELNSLKLALHQKKAEVEQKDQRLSSMQNELVQLANEKFGLEKRSNSLIDQLQATVEDLKEELEYLRSMQGDGSREEELLRRIEEDDAKIEALEMLLRDTADVKKVEERLRDTQEKLKEEAQRLDDSEFRNIELLNEKEQALDDLETTTQQIALLKAMLEEKDSQIKRLSTDSPPPQTPVVMLHRADEDDDTQSPGAIQVFPGENTVRDMERLLAAVDRLRDERNQLRQDIQFLQTESEFAIDALEARIEAMSQQQGLEGDLHATVEDLRTRLQRAHAFSKKRAAYTQRLAVGLLAAGVVVQHLYSRVEVLEASQQEQAPQQDSNELSRVMGRLTVTIEALAQTTGERDNLRSQLDTRDSEFEDMKAAYDDLCTTTDRLETQLADASASLEEVESQRNSLALQVTNLTMDLEGAQKELTEAEKRYSELQFHQLNNMSSSEVTRALRQQIQDLEDRVMRRTEQIGIHQHDIKRMEINMKLQEERLAEMTIEMDTLASQKDAMVEDCADAREARDDALSKVEKLEVDMEAMEGTIADNKKTIQTLLQAVFAGMMGNKHIKRRSMAYIQSLGQELRSMRTRSQSDLSEKDARLATLERLLQNSSQEVRQMTVALATSQVEFGKRAASDDEEAEQTQDLQHQIFILRNQLDSGFAETKTLVSQLEEARKEISDAGERHKRELSELEGQLRIARENLTSSESEQKRVTESLESELKEKDQLLSKDDVESQIVQLKMQHIEEMGVLQSQVVRLESAFEEARTMTEDAEARCKQALEDAARSKTELEESMKKILTSESLREELQTSLSTRDGDLEDLRRRLDAAEQDTKALQASREEIDAQYHKATEELQRIKESNSTDTAQHEATIIDLKKQMEGQTEKLEQAADELCRLREQVQAEVVGRAADVAQLQESINQLTDESRQFEDTSAEIREALEAARMELQDARAELAALVDERTTLQQTYTSLEADYQRSLSLTRYLERQVHEYENAVKALRADLEKTRQDLASSQAACNKAQITLDISNANHTREMKRMEGEIDTLKSRPNLEHALAELEERNNEMEELLKKKCAEIEENDDRTLEMMKENKKLNTRVESLNRKIQNLQAKLAAAKAAAPAQKTSPEHGVPARTETISPPIASARPRAITMTTTASPSVPATLPPMPCVPASNRVVSGPSTTSRPKTPEKKSLFVFRPRSPEKHSASTPQGHPGGSTPLSNKKRPPPEDYDSLARNLPAQGFTPECVRSDADGEASTPRVRRVFTSIQSGFTPSRHPNRPVAPLPSPRGSDAAKLTPRATYMADLTNNVPTMPAAPQVPPVEEDKSAKRSWLGKIRGAAQAPAANRARADRQRLQ